MLTVQSIRIKSVVNAKCLLSRSLVDLLVRWSRVRLLRRGFLRDLSLGGYRDDLNSVESFPRLLAVHARAGSAIPVAMGQPKKLLKRPRRPRRQDHGWHHSGRIRQISHTARAAAARRA